MIKKSFLMVLCMTSGGLTASEFFDHQKIWRQASVAQQQQNINDDDESIDCCASLTRAVAGCVLGASVPFIVSILTHYKLE